MAQLEQRALEKEDRENEERDRHGHG
jgi:hypothetical protein